MRTSIRQTLFAAGAVIAMGGFSAPGMAAGGGDPTAVHPSPSGGQGAGRADHARNAESVVEEKIASLHARLEITPAQQGQWEQFAQVMRDNAQSIDQAFQLRVKAMPGMSAVENMQSYADLATEHAKEMQKLVPAFQSVYDTFTDSQKRRADDEFRTNANAHHGEQARHDEPGRRG